MDKHLTIRVPRRLLKAALVLTIVGAVIAPIAVSASHQFTDVADDNIFHDNIGWLADNDVTKGCNPPTNDQFCPEDNVTRGQMAAFMQRLAEGKVVDAATAVTADSASMADDAEMLDGEAPTAYQTVVAGAQRDWLSSGQIDVDGDTPTTALDLEFEVPADGFAAITGIASLRSFPAAATSASAVWVQLDNTTCNAGAAIPNVGPHVPGTLTYLEFDADVSVLAAAGTGVVPVTAGMHTATLCVVNNSAADTSDVHDAGLTAIVSPLGVSETTPPAVLPIDTAGEFS